MSDESNSAEKIAERYGPGGKFADYQTDDATRDTAIQNGRAIARFIQDQILPRNRKSKITILDPTSNKGFVEVGLTELISANDVYQIITGDVAEIKLAKTGSRYRGKAEILPIQSGSVSIVIDLNGALWFNAFEDTLSVELMSQPRKNFAQVILEEYKRILMPGGVLVIDESTHSFIERSGEKVKLDGFEKFQAVDKTYDTAQQLFFARKPETA